MRSEKSHVSNLYTYIKNVLQTIQHHFERKTTVFLILIIIFNYFILASADFHIDRFVSLVFVAHMNRKLCMFRQNHGNLLHQQLQQKQFKICHSPHSSHATLASQHGRRAGQQRESQLFNVCKVGAVLTDAERRNRKTVSLLRPGAAQHNPTMHLFRWHISLIKLVSLSLGKKGRSLGYEAAATYQSRQQEGKKNPKTLMLKNRHVGILCVCVCELCLNYHCLQQWKKLFVSHRKTLSHLLSAFFSLSSSVGRCRCLVV